MTRNYEKHGIRFQYPPDWDLHEDRADNRVSLSVNSPDTSFWTLTLDFDRPDPQLLIQAAVEAFQQEYAELDGYATEESVGDHPAIGSDLEFACLDLLNTACLRSFRTGRFTAFLLFQGCDAELETTRPLLDAITASLECDAR